MKFEEMLRMVADAMPGRPVPTECVLFTDLVRTREDILEWRARPEAIKPLTAEVWARLWGAGPRSADATPLRVDDGRVVLMLSRTPEDATDRAPMFGVFTSEEALHLT